VPCGADNSGAELAPVFTIGYGDAARRRLASYCILQMQEQLTQFGQDCLFHFFGLIHYELKPPPFLFWFSKEILCNKRVFNFLSPCKWPTHRISTRRNAKDLRAVVSNNNIQCVRRRARLLIKSFGKVTPRKTNTTTNRYRSSAMLHACTTSL
jgi:hypothetical protein